MPTTLTNGIQLPDKGSVDWYSSMQSNYNLIDTHLGDTDVHVTAEDKANWNSKQGSLSQTQLDAIAQVATNTSNIATLQSGKANASHTHSSSDITDIGDYATKQYVDNSISGLVDSAPNALDTLNELAAALNDDANFASTVTNALSAKANSSDLATVATSGSYNDLIDTPTIPTNTSDLTNDSNFVVSSSLATVATSGDYDDLSNKPSIPTNTSDLNNDSGFVTLNDFDIPSKTSDLTNDSGFITSSDVPTGTSDLINDSNFVDTSNSAVASGITSAKVTSYDSHIADTDIHVTTADKNRWNNNTYVFRYSSTALVASSTNSNTLLDNTDNLKVGDKVIDSNGVLFSITAIDTANSTFTIGTALIDLAQDSDVLHKSGNETVGGVKRFTNDIIRGTVNTNSTIQARNLIGNTTTSTAGSNSSSYQSITATLNYSDSTPSKLATVSLYVVENAYSDGKYSSFRPNSSNLINLGTSEKKWANVYATNYYYGSNNVEFSTKFVTSDTNQTITGTKTFSGVDINLKSSIAEYGVLGGGLSTIYSDKNSVQLAQIKLGNYTSGTSYEKFSIYAYDSNNQQVGCTVTFSWASLTKPFIRPDNNNLVGLGTIGNRWSDVQTYKVNALEPSSLSLPSGNANNVIDISSYITDMSGIVNNYTAPANGWISIAITGTAIAIVSSSWSDSRLRESSGNVRMLYPVLKNETLSISVIGTTLAYARFIPCQGNV